MKKSYGYKEFNFSLLKILIIIFFVLGTINYIVNPYNIFDNRVLKISLLKPEAKIQERYTKFIALKLDKRQIETVFMGTSRADLALNKYYYEKLTGKSSENLALGGVFIYEYFDELRKLILIHPEVKNLYVGLDFINFDINRKDNNKTTRYKIKEEKSITSSELGFALFSLKSTGDSIWTVIKNLIGIEKRMFCFDGTKHIFVNKEIDNEFKKTLEEYRGYYDNFAFDDSMIEKIKELKKLCKEKNIKIYFFIMPSHILDQYLIYKKCKNDYKKWKIELSKISDIYDFQYPNNYTEEEIKPDMKYFFETSHSTSNLGNKIIDFMVNQNGDFGRILTNTNVQDILKQDEKAIGEYFKKNQDLAFRVEGK